MEAEESTKTAGVQLMDANLFTVEGPIAITYSSTSVSGDPLFSYRDAKDDLQFSGDEITRTATPIGEMVTVVLQHAVDTFTRTFTLIVPKARVVLGDSADFATIGIQCVDTSQAFVLPAARAGVKQTYQICDLKGQAHGVIS